MTLHAEFRTHRVAVGRITRADDGEGGWKATLGTVGTVDGSLQPAGSYDTVVAAAEEGVMRWQFLADDDADIVRDDVLTVVALRRVPGWASVVETATYRVLSVSRWIDPNAGQDHINVQLEEIQRGE